MISFVYGSDEFYKRYSLPESAFKPNNASAIFGGQLSFGIGPAESSIFRPTKPAPKPPKERKKVGRSNSDVGVRKSAVERRKAKEKEVVPRRNAEFKPKNHFIENGAVSPRSSISNEGEGGDCQDIDLTDSLESNGDRYPLFIPVNDKSQGEVKPRKSPKTPSPPSNRPGHGESPKRSPGTQGQRSSRAGVRRSASFSSSAPRRTSESESGHSPKVAVVKPRVVGNSPVSRPPYDSLRREKSDIITVRARGSPFPASPRRENSDLKSKNPSGLRREKSDITCKRSHSPGGYKRENSDLVRPRGSSSPLAVRREKSDVVSPRGRPAIGKRENSDLSRPRTKAQATQNISTNCIKENNRETLINGISKSTSNKNLSKKSLSPNRTQGHSENQQDKTHIQHSSDMSKIPTPQSRIPSLTKHNAPEPARAPPKSKIPSLGKADKKGPKESHIPAPGSVSKEKPVSKIPGASGRPDSSKENQDPTLNHESTEDTPKTSKPVSRIPSASKSGSKSKIPSVSRQDSHGKSSVSSGEHLSDENLANEEAEPMVNGTHKPVGGRSKIPSLSGSTPHSHQTSGIPTSGSKIPSVARTTPTAKDKVDATPPSSKIPHPGSSSSTPATTTPKTGIPTFAASPASKGPTEPVVNGTGKTEAKSKIPSLSGAHQNSGTPASPKTEQKPENQEPKISRIPSLSSAHQQSGSPVAANTEKTEHESKIPAHNESKIPSLGGAPKSKIPSVSASRLPRKPSEEEKTADHKPEEKEAQAPKDSPAAKVAPPPPPRKDSDKETAVVQSPMEKYIFSEAKKMEKLLRDEDIVVEVEVPPSEKVEEQKESKKTEYELQQAEICRFEKAQEAEDLISEVLKSYAPDLPTYSSDRSLDLLSNDRTPEHKPKLTPVKTATPEEKKPEKTKEEVAFQTFGKRSTPPIERAKVDTSKARQSPKDAKKDISLDLSGVSDKKKEERVVKKDEGVKAADALSPPASSPETPAIDTLGGYEQQSRRSRSRQRKVITPDTEEPPKAFSDEPNKADVDKSKLGKSSLESEPAKDTKPATKPAKSKNKHEFVIESSLGKDFYASKKPDDNSSKENIHDDIPKSDLIVIQNKSFEEKIKAEAKPEKGKVASQAFEDVDLSSQKGSKQEMRAWSMEDLDEKTVKCACGRGGKCVVM